MNLINENVLNEMLGYESLCIKDVKMDKTHISYFDLVDWKKNEVLLENNFSKFLNWAEKEEKILLIYGYCVYIMPDDLNTMDIDLENYPVCVGETTMDAIVGACNMIFENKNKN